MIAVEKLISIVKSKGKRKMQLDRGLDKVNELKLH